MRINKNLTLNYLDFDGFYLYIILGLFNTIVPNKFVKFIQQFKRITKHYNRLCQMPNSFDNLDFQIVDGLRIHSLIIKVLLI